MKTLSKIATTLCSLIVLSACSGGGSDGGNSSNATPTTPVNNQPSLTELKKLPLGEVKEDVKFGKVAGYNNRYSFHGAWVEHEGVGEIIVDQAKLQLANTFSSIGGLQGMAMSKAFEAAWNSFLKNPERGIFYFGDETSAKTINSMRGTATYKGHATRYDNVKGTVENIGISTLIADFDHKKIKGELDMTYPRRNVTLKQTDIKGNGFEGTAIVEGNFPFFISHTGKYEGKFFGNNAEEVAGKATFDKDVKDLDTSFSGER